MFTPSPLFTDHCVLPMGRELRIFGTAQEGERIHAVLAASDGRVLSQGRCTARDGRFLVRLSPQEAAVGAQLTLTGAQQVFCARDVAVGYLLLAGGQSNMEWSLWNADEGQALIAQHDDPELRYFNVPRVSLPDDAPFQAARWQRIAPHQGGDMSAVGYFFACRVRRETGVPVGILGCNWGGTSAACWIDEASLRRTALGASLLDDYARKTAGVTVMQWQEKEDAFQADMAAWNARVAQVKAEQPGIEWAQIEAIAGKCPWNPPDGPGSPYRPAGLAETMLRLIVPASLSGVMYYQGESDAERAPDYAQLLTHLALRWRELFRDAQLPFFNVQLPMFIEDGKPDLRDWAVLRQAQDTVRRTLSGSYLAVMIDGGERNNIHPTDKRTPGERLAGLFLESLGGERVRQPWALGKESRGGELLVRVSEPLRCEGEPALFEIAGEDGLYVPARAQLDGSRILLRAPGVEHPVSARYAWVNWGRVNVFADAPEGLPLAPFLLEE